ncbi:uncharacterized protein LOC132272665 [Cornus florida]|uniref:uncharacterized protein LOC132272665 n=1 Tax=Cornus florida TaxID=4283 RepID=UPI0028A08786|nr:uncharacterized protein LOC132272665 [Cornus florida]
MVILSNDHCLAFCTLGDTSWTSLEDYEWIFIPVDLVYSNKDELFYCKHECSALHAWNLHNLSSPRRIDIKTGHFYGTPDFPESEKKLRDYSYHCLAFESHSGDLLLVKRFVGEVADDGTIIDDSDSNSFKTHWFVVYRLNTIKRGWNYVTDLGDGVLFIGGNHAFHLSANDFVTGVLIHNSIYFNIDYECYYDMGIYNMQDFTVKSIFPSHLHALNNIEHHPPIWFTPNPENK